ncbi:MAG: toll/interleukin-1 receptor domain-containing protein, partial [Anaerolineales bacterium]|nr:toll/interleukin-1 receptor domain-containing protein [Anaerolineales bacterium]
MTQADDIQKLIANHERRLQKLREEQALKGYSTEAHILTEIDDINATLTDLRAELARLQPRTPTVDPRLLRGHYFISYAPTDGADVALALHQALAKAEVPTWLDQQHLDPAASPERQINEALQTCAGLLLLVTADSGDTATGAPREWGQALSYKRPLVLLHLDPTADIPYRLVGYPIIELSDATVRGEGEALTAAVAQLREQLDGL